MGNSLFKLTSLNLNGIRSAASKGVEAWLAKAKPDCICVQEVKCQADDVRGRFDELGVNFQKRLTDGRMKNIAFIKDPDG